MRLTFLRPIALHTYSFWNCGDTSWVMCHPQSFAENNSACEVVNLLLDGLTAERAFGRVSAFERRRMAPEIVRLRCGRLHPLPSLHLHNSSESSDTWIA